MSQRPITRPPNRRQFTPEHRVKLDRMRMQRQAHAQRMILGAQPLIDAVKQCPIVMNLSFNSSTGALTFRFDGRRVAYYVTTFRLITRNPLGSTDRVLTPSEFINEFKKERKHAFPVFVSGELDVDYSNDGAE